MMDPLRRHFVQFTNGPLLKAEFMAERGTLSPSSAQRQQEKAEKSERATPIISSQYTAITQNSKLKHALIKVYVCNRFYGDRGYDERIGICEGMIGVRVGRRLDLGMGAAKELQKLYLSCHDIAIGNH
ncbi:hypothetical protein WG66_002630 [Moniliophthora roreri]|nr:hypothetical protein WG66_002630 [Moniliophthora roreri]